MSQIAPLRPDFPLGSVGVDGKVRPDPLFYRWLTEGVYGRMGGADAPTITEIADGLDTITAAVNSVGLYAVDAKYGTLDLTGETDSSAVFAAVIDDMLSREAAHVILPPGIIRLDQAIARTLTQVGGTYGLQGVYDQTFILVNNTTGGLLFDAKNNKNALHVRGVTFAPGVGGAGTGLRWYQDVQRGGQQKRMFSMEFCGFRTIDKNAPYWFDCALDLHGYYRPLLHKTFFWAGSQDAYAPGAHVKVDACYAPNIQHVQINGKYEIGLTSVGGEEEGFFADRVFVTNAKTGIFISRNDRQPNLCVTNSNIKGSEAGLVVSGVKQGFFFGNFFAITPQDEGADSSSQPREYYDIKIEDAEACVFWGNIFKGVENLKRWHYYLKPGGFDEDGISTKRNPVVRNLKIWGSNYTAATGTGYGVFKAESTVIDTTTISPKNIEFDLPYVFSTDSNAAYPDRAWSVEDGLVGIIGVTPNGSVTFTADASADAFVNYQDSATPVASDSIDAIRMDGNNSAMSRVQYALTRASITDTTPGAESASYQIFARQGGSFTNVAGFGSGMNLKGAGGQMGDGTANIQKLYVMGQQVVAPRVTGWTAPTGTATRTTFATPTVTLPQLAERVKALIDDLTAHGLIGT